MCSQKFSLFINFYFVSIVLWTVSCYDQEKHYSDFGYLSKKGKPYWCYCCIVDNIHLLTSASCFFLGSKIQSTPSPEISNFTLIRFDSSGQLSIELQIDKIIIYPYTNFLSSDSMHFITTAKDDFSLLILKEKLPFSSDIMLIEWPLSIHEDYENLMEYYESQSRKAIIWSHRKKKPVVYEGTLIDRKDCQTILGCQEFTTIGCVYFKVGYNVRCAINTKAHQCPFDIKSAPVIVDDILWGLTADCVKNVTIYYAFDRNFKFIYDILESKTFIVSDKGSINSKIAFGVIILLILTVAVIFIICHKLRLHELKQQKLKKVEESRKVQKPHESPEPDSYFAWFPCLL